jgi:methionyl-tRNA formyltransferase
MLPKVVWAMPKYGTFNLHASLLPHYRGAAPINWVIMNGEKETGVTTFFIDDKIDTGEIILQEKTTVGPHETAGELHDKLMVLGASLIIKTVDEIEKGEIQLTKQPKIENLKLAHKIHKETCKIDWSLPMGDIYNHIRGLSPYPTAWTTLVDGKNETFLKIFKIDKEKSEHLHRLGQVLSDKKSMKVAVKNGYLILNEIQLPGKRKMMVGDVLNGLQISKDAYMR